jgi:hypothetical protein
MASRASTPGYVLPLICPDTWCLQNISASIEPHAICATLLTVALQVSGGISWLDDIQQFYRERSAIEKEYSAKLSALAKKYYEKKARKTTSLSVGDTPTATPGSLERYSRCLCSAWLS